MQQRNRRGEPARAALVEAAEQLFAERGIDAVSLRDVSKAAGQRNHSAAQYHFGDRHGLVAAVYSARMVGVDRRRRAYVDQLGAGGRDRDVRGLVEAIVVPLFEVVAESDGWYARFLARTRWDPAAWDVVIGLDESSTFTEVIADVAAALAHLRPAVRRHRIDQLMTLVIGTIAGWEGAPDRDEPRLGRDAFVAELVAAAVAVLAVAAPARTSLTDIASESDLTDPTGALA